MTCHVLIHQKACCYRRENCICCGPDQGKNCSPGSLEMEILSEESCSNAAESKPAGWSQRRLSSACIPISLVSIVIAGATLLAAAGTSLSTTVSAEPRRATQPLTCRMGLRSKPCICEKDIANTSAGSACQSCMKLFVVLPLSLRQCRRPLSSNPAEFAFSNKHNETSPAAPGWTSTWRASQQACNNS